MKKIITIIMLIGLFSCNTDKKSTQKTDLTSNRIEILEFYGKHRCTSCINIERNTKETLKKYFSKEIENKQLIYKLIQWDIPENDALVDKFEAAGTSLIIYRVKDGKEFIQDISDFAFKENENDTTFENKLKTLIETEFKKQ